MAGCPAGVTIIRQRFRTKKGLVTGNVTRPKMGYLHCEYITASQQRSIIQNTSPASSSPTTSAPQPEEASTSGCGAPGVG
jgi:hypothetical protein